MIDYEYPWYGYIMVDSPNGLGDWNFHIVNLEDGSNTIIANKELYNSVPLHVYSSIDSGILYLSTSTFKDDFAINSSSVYAIDLNTNKAALLIDNQDMDTFMSVISASNGYLLIENDPPKDQPTLHISLFESQIKPGSTSHRNILGVCKYEYPYLIWKNSNRFEEPFSFTVFNMDTGVSVVRNITGRDAYDPIISNGFAIVQASTGKDRSTNSLILYSLDGWEIYAIKIGIDNIFAADAYIDHGNVIFNFRETAYFSDFPVIYVKSPSIL